MQIYSKSCNFNGTWAGHPVIIHNSGDELSTTELNYDWERWIHRNPWVNTHKLINATCTCLKKVAINFVQRPQQVYKMNAVKKHYDPDALPREFDSRKRWPRDISGVKDQGWCGASWAVSTADVASDRFALMSKGAEAISLSAQHLISCNNRGQQGCRGGYLDRAWLYMRKFG